ncbi:MAG: hypothetical protein DIZ80_00160 [endosymbiont of Galathealinum brachiosum]|uniref:Uncharacterized protein n=1 Tax=endosymbiont of Galathealinum brachiosum TaxID=2200906 RepID=A0A370DLY3_9GAMM|nr:MAG: hypothetical protein DIZ80_00160 [endosymbiont of Galathealinum brachiosum]
MVAAKKIETTDYSPQHSSRLMSLLLDKNYKKSTPTNSKTHTVEMKYSRIEAEHEMEKAFINLL